MSASRIPSSLRFALVCAISLGLSSLFYTLTSDVSGFQFASASKDLEETWQIGALLGWKLLQLGIAWFARYDYQDLAALTLLTNQPYYYLLSSFFAIQPLAAFTSLAIDIAVIAIPFALLRPLARAHDLANVQTTNQAIAKDWQIMGLTSILGAAVFAVTFYLSYYANLGSFLIVHFDEIPSLESAHDSSIAHLMQMFIVNGIGAMVFLFMPSVAAAGRPSLTDPSAAVAAKKFRPESATLAETFAYNLGYGVHGWSHRAEVLLKRTLVLVGCTFANTFIRIFGTVLGTDVVGSLGYAGIWTAANVLVAVAYAWLAEE